MEKFLFLSNAGDGFGLAHRLREAGHSVAGWIRGKRSRSNYQGIIPKVEKWEDWLDAKTIVVFDSTGGGKLADRLRGKGHFVFGASAFADQIEFDRATGFALLEEAGVKVPESHTFLNWEDGRNFARKNDRRFVFKPSGKLAAEAGVGTYVASDAEDLVEMLHYFQSVSSAPPEFELQEHVGKGVAISTEGWFNGEDWLWPFNHTAERKQMMDQNQGPSMGCSGNVVWAADRLNQIIDKGIGTMADVLRRENYVGPIDLNTVVTPDGVWALEFTPRFGYDAMPALLALFGGDSAEFGELLAKLARGEKPKDMVLKGGFGAGLHISVPPYPSDEAKHFGGVPIRGFTKEDSRNLYFYDVMLNERDQLVTAPDCGAGFVALGQGSSIAEAFSKPYQLANKAKMPEKQFRTDMISQMQQDYDEWSAVAHEHNKAKEAAVVA